MSTSPPGTTGWYPIGPPEPPRKNWVRRHKVWATVGAVISAIAIIVIAAGIAGSPRQAPHHVAAPTPVFTPFSEAAPAPSPTLVPPNRVAFIITGSVPGGQYSSIDITYGSDSDQHNVSVPALNGRLRYVVPFDGSAQYYSVDVLFTNSGNVSCKIVVLGPSPDAPLVVSHGSASSSGGSSSGGDCSAQAAPNDSTGMSWQNEQ